MRDIGVGRFADMRIRRKDRRQYRFRWKSVWPNGATAMKTREMTKKARRTKGLPTRKRKKLLDERIPEHDDAARSRPARCSAGKLTESLFTDDNVFCKAAEAALNNLDRKRSPPTPRSSSER